MFVRVYLVCHPGNNVKGVERSAATQRELGTVPYLIDNCPRELALLSPTGGKVKVRGSQPPEKLVVHSCHRAKFTRSGGTGHSL